jgi:hypothetical protein
MCSSCFEDCTSLTSITFESNAKLQRIEGIAFASSGLTELLLPNSIHFLSGSAFMSLSLNSISFWPGRCEFQVHEIKIISELCFYKCTFLTSVTFESSSKLQRIEEGAFAGSGLKTIQITASVEVLCKCCFSKCTSLTSVTFESNSKLQRIEERAFEQSGLKTIQIPASAEVLCKCCFLQCTSLTSVTFESNSKLHGIEESAFQASGLRTIQIPASVEVLCKSCFSKCTSLTSITFESNSKLQRIEEYAFYESGLTELLLPNSIHFLSGSAFVDLPLHSISFWPGRCGFQVHEMFIENIAGRSLIHYFGRSTAVVIQSRIEIINECCFYNCRSLTSVTFESNSTVPELRNQHFEKVV